MCGVIGVIGSQDTMEEGPFVAAREIYQGLLTLQHRGQDAAGILTYDLKDHRFSQKKDLGLVSQVFDERDLDFLPGTMGVGHTRYATVGAKEDLQPIMTGLPFGVGMVHNGNLVNYHSLAKKMTDRFNIQLLTRNDLELILQMWCYYLLQEENSTGFDFRKGLSAMKKVVTQVEGGYAIIGMVANKGLIAFRDPQGIRPLMIGRKKINGKDAYCVCSETVAMNFLGYRYWRSVLPGEFLFIDTDGNIQSDMVKTASKKASCMFEWVYFSGAEGVLEERSVYTTRLRLGERLAIKARAAISKKQINPHVVAPVPDTSRTASIALAENLNLPYREVFIKNRYSHRSFILDTQEKRKRTVELKLSPVFSEIEGKNIMLVDDSIVRGTTAQRIVSLLKEYGAKEVTLAITCPPIRYPCYYGIDFPSPGELIASGRTVDQITKIVGANQVIYLDEEDLKEAIGLDSLCMACLNHHYPTSIEEGASFSKLRKRG